MKDIDEWLDSVQVLGPGAWENEDGPDGWYAVSTDEDGGIIAYFRDEAMACSFKLSYINRKMNG